MRVHQFLAVPAFAIAFVSPHVARAQATPSWRSVDYARQLHDSAPQRVRVDYAAGRVDIRGSDQPLLYGMHLRYDEARSTPLHRYDASQHSTMLGIESRGGDIRTASRDGESGELRLTLPRSVPLDLDLSFGGTESTMDLGDMTLEGLTLKYGAGPANLLFSGPNRVRMRALDVNVGAAAFTASHLGNANADQMRLQGRIGDVDLDFSGLWQRDLVVDARLDIGKLTLRLPPDVGVRVDIQRALVGFDHAGLVKRGDSWYTSNFDTAAHKVQIRAETYVGKIEVQQTSR